MKKIILPLIFLLAAALAYAQENELGDTLNTEAKLPAIIVPKDSAAIADSIRRAQIRRVTRRSAMVPGWGQITNKQAWKVPIIYAALGVTTYIFFDNLNSYRELRQAYIYRTDTIIGNEDNIPERFRPLSTNSIRFYRDEFRKNVDYSVLAFLIMWGLNVVDATVFANLKDFDVTDDISLRLNHPTFNPINGSGQLGISLHLKPPSKQLKPLPAR